MSLRSKVSSALKQGGIRYVISRSPHYIKWRVWKKMSDIAYRLYNPHGYITRSELISQCEETNTIWYYGTKDKLDIAPPLSGPAPDTFHEIIGEHTIPESFVCEIDNVRLIGHRALPQTRDGRYILEELGKEGMMKSRILNTFSLQSKIREAIYSNRNKFESPEFDTIINMVPRHGASHNNYVNYGHWLVEDLPRLRGYDRYKNATSRTPKLLIKSNPPSWMTQTLELLGFSSSDWLEWNQKDAAASRLVIPKLSYIHSIGAEYQPTDRKWVSEQIKSNIDGTSRSSPPEYIFISRQGQSRRKIVNFAEVEKILKQLGFDIIRPEKLDFEQQVQLFSQADIIIGPFGAGLVNMIFADNASVIEIKPYNTDHTIFYILANECDFQYDCLFGEPLDANEKSDKNSNIFVDTETLQNRIENVINRTQ